MGTIYARLWLIFDINLLMDTKAISEHDKKGKLEIIPTLIVCGCISLVCVVGVGVGIFMWVTGKIAWWHGLLIIPAGCLIAFVCMFMLIRFVVEVVPVRKILLFEHGKLGIVTWREKIFMAELPENIKSIVRTGSDLSVEVQINNRRFIVDSDRFSNKEKIVEFLQPYYPLKRIIP